MPRTMRPKTTVLSAAVLVTLAPTAAHAQTYADSIADYSGTQGQGGWYYGFYDGRPGGGTAYTPDDFELMPNFGTWTYPSGGGSFPDYWYRLAVPGGYWTYITETSMQPNGTRPDGNARSEVNWTVRRWVSTVTGPASINILAVKPPPDPGNGTILHVFRGSQQVVNQLVEPGNETGVRLSLPLCLQAGEVFDFGIDPRSGDHFYDGTLFHVTVTGPIVEQPVSATICGGGAATLAVQINPALTDLAVQWRRDGSPIAGATSPALDIPAVTPQDAGTYDCLISNGCGTTLTEPARLTVDIAPTITLQPASQDLCAGAALLLMVDVAGTPAPLFQWRKDGVSLPGATGPTYLVNTADDVDAGTYDVQIANLCGTLISDAATVIVWPIATGDADGDGAVDGRDIAAFVNVILRSSTWPATLESCAADMNADGEVDQLDIPIFVGQLL